MAPNGLDVLSLALAVTLLEEWPEYCDGELDRRLAGFVARGDLVEQAAHLLPVALGRSALHRRNMAEGR